MEIGVQREALYLEKREAEDTGAAPGGRAGARPDTPRAGHEQGDRHREHRTLESRRGRWTGAGCAEAAPCTAGRALL